MKNEVLGTPNIHEKVESLQSFTIFHWNRFGIHLPQDAF
jgi:hypothetical protein